MVLRLKTRESRSLPGLQNARSKLSSLYEKARQTGSRAAQAALSFGGTLKLANASMARGGAAR
jgi:hypothetical protein